MHYASISLVYIILVITYTLLHALYRLLIDFLFSAGPTDERYVTGGFGLVWHFVTGGQNWPKKRYVIVERPLSNLVIVTLRQLSIHGNVSYLEINQIHELKHKYTCVHPTRLDRLLYVPRTKTKTLGSRGFYYASSAMWNSLPVDMRDPGLSLHSFRTKLKSYFFTVDWLFFFPVVHSCTLLL